MTEQTDSPNGFDLVGVIGGVGPLATAYFLELVVRLTRAGRDQEHVNAVVLNHAAIPDRTEYVLGRSEEDPGPVLARDAVRLERFGADFLVMPCNTAHYFTEQVLAAIEVPFLSIIDVTVDAVLDRAPGLAAVGLLATEGTVASGVYQRAFAAHGIEVLTLGDGGQAALNAVIYDQVKAGLPSEPGTLRSLAAGLHDAGAGAVVLGCTELSVAAVDHNLLDDPLLVDSMDQLARATIRRAGRAVRD